MSGPPTSDPAATAANSTEQDRRLEIRLAAASVAGQHATPTTVAAFVKTLNERRQPSRLAQIAAARTPYSATDVESRLYFAGHLLASAETKDQFAGMLVLSELSVLEPELVKTLREQFAELAPLTIDLASAVAAGAELTKVGES